MKLYSDTETEYVPTRAGFILSKLNKTVLKQTRLTFRSVSESDIDPVAHPRKNNIAIQVLYSSKYDTVHYKFCFYFILCARGQNAFVSAYSGSALAQHN